MIITSFWPSGMNAIWDECYFVIEEWLLVKWYLILISTILGCIQDEEAKSEQIEEEVVDNNAKPEFSETQSPVESHDSDDDFLRWSQYKSEL